MTERSPMQQAEALDDSLVERRCGTRSAGSGAAFAIAAVLAAAVVLACGSSSNDSRDAGGSPCVSAPSCPANVPSYKNDIVPILQNACIPCHSPTGNAGYDESTYEQVYQQFGSILDQVSLCQMPPLNGPVMSDTQRIALTGWLECGAPEN